jgi:uncharacterized protein (TIGR03083 family)
VLALDVAHLMRRQADHGSLDLGVRELLATPGGIDEIVLLSPPGTRADPPATPHHRHDPTFTTRHRTGQNSPAKVSRYRRRPRGRALTRRGIAMAVKDQWTLIHAERDALATDLGGLDASQWQNPSLCGQWTVREVLAHMTATAAMTPIKFVGKFLGSGFDFKSLTSKGVRGELGDSAAETLARFKAQAASTTSPPGPMDSWVGETIVHAEDIRRPLVIAHTYAPAAVRRVADFCKGSNMLIGAKNRIAGVTLRATDTDWSHGSGPEVMGPLLSLVMAMTGRKVALDDLEGPGLYVLRSRD